MTEVTCNLYPRPIHLSQIDHANHPLNMRVPNIPLDTARELARKLKNVCEVLIEHKKPSGDNVHLLLGIRGEEVLSILEKHGFKETSNGYVPDDNH